MESLLQMHGKKMVTMDDVRGRGGGENFVVEGLRGFLVTLSSFLQKLEQMLPPENRASGPPEDTEWIFPTKMMMPPRSGPPTLYEHELIVAAISLLLLIILSLGGLYYYYCYQAGCFGDGGHPAMLMNAAGRKTRIMSR
ncbi:unnamed protein product [Spirodela intermedia]|uniref:Uncharacterized protein n=1 Tax=Spirodela intermedia TaxID=51605 RepID=A0A7I8IJ03_SPIIN|nr:unnamed protein product [Spirodela intermedia]CAA6657329.1 unnamed protein product [Spirodela intermedia]